MASVACAKGCIVIGSRHLYRVSPGGWDVQYRGLPAGTEMPVSVAMEPRPPFRVAGGPPDGDVVIFTDTTNANSIMGHSFNGPRGSNQAVVLSWVVNDEQSSLFARTDDGGLYRMQTEGWDGVEMPPVHAIAHDETGGFAALTVVDGEPKAYITHDGGDHFSFRSFGVQVEAEPDAPASLSLAGTAVTAVVGDSGPLVSRGAREPTTRHEELGRAYAVSFQGPAPDAWIYVGVQRRGRDPAAVWLLDTAGNKLKVMDFLADDDAPLDLGALAWDSARSSLLVSSRGGLVAVGPEVSRPKRSRAKKRVVQ